MKFSAEKARIDYDKDGMILTVRVLPESRYAVKSGIGELPEKLSVEVKKWTKPRSLDANAYFWVLAGKLAEKLQISPEAVYRNYIKDIGGNFVITPIRNDAKETWIKNWQSKGLGWLCDDLGQSKLEGYSNILNYYGSSTYDSAQMSRLIDLIVQDCRAQGIETMTPLELARLNEGMGET